jgi:hypothetical protein
MGISKPNTVLRRIELAEITIMSCCLCGNANHVSNINELINRGWFANEPAYGGTYAKTLICPTCVTRIMGRQVSVTEMQNPLTRKKIEKSKQDELPIFKDIPKEFKYRRRN